MENDRMRVLLVIVFVGVLLSGTGCLTKKFVSGEVAAVDQKIEEVESSVEENQKRIKEHDERLATLGSLVSEQDSKIQQFDSKLNSKFEEVKRYSQGRLIFQETLRNDQAKFKFDSYELSAEAQVILDDFVKKLVEEDKGVYIEIQGHTDSTGPDAWNLLLGKKRAESVMYYLHTKYRIPLHRMEVISYGSSSPIADNKSRIGRAQNRRVEILVYE